MNDTRFDQLIRELTEKLFPVCDWHLIKAQVAQESAFDPNAKSPVGALGLLQLMPFTGKELGLSEQDLLIPEKNLDAGIRYLRLQYICFPEIAEHEEKLKSSLCKVNGKTPDWKQATGYVEKIWKRYLSGKRAA